MIKVARYIVVIGLIAVCFGILGRFLYLDWYYYGHAPRKADVVQGHVFPAHVNHSTTVYLTAEQWRWFQSSTASVTFAVLFLIAAAGASVLNRKWRVFS
jgi:hypothetical protein